MQVGMSGALGAVSTVAVACGCAWWVDVSAGRHEAAARPLTDAEVAELHPIDGKLSSWQIDRTAAFGSARVHFAMTGYAYGYGDRTFDELWPTWGRLDRLTRAEAIAVDSGLHDARGWPMLAMHCSVGSWQDDSVRGGFRLPDRTAPNGGLVPRVLPVRPIVFGCTVDTLLYGGLWFAILFAPGLVRRAWRRHCGWCVGCGYDLRGTTHELCAECGHSAMFRRADLNPRSPAG